MVRSVRPPRPVLQVLAVLLVLAFALPAAAQVAKKRKSGLDDLEFQRPELRLAAQTVSIEEARPMASPALQQDFDALLTREDVRWQMHFDLMTALPDSMGGEGIPWIPGTGWRNTLKARNLGLAEGAPVPVSFVANKALDFVRAYPGLFGARVEELSLNAEGSVPMMDYMYYVQFDWVYQGVPVENARLVFTLNHGNLIEVGQSNFSRGIRDLDTRPALSVDTAWQIAYGYLGEAGPDPADTVVQPGQLLIVPVVAGKALEGMPSDPGQGLGYRLVWVLGFHREGVLGTWEVRVDAHTGEILAFMDRNAYGSVKGGVYKTDKPFVEQNVPLPFVDYGGSVFADQAGNFPGTTGTSTLTGRTGSAGNVGSVDINDNCGSASLAATAGIIDFGTSGGYDCTTPGVGGGGNTHAARTQYWNVAQIKIKAYTYLTTNSWLQGRLTDNVNINDTCNAYWNGVNVNFFRSGGGCWNTGELPGVSLHEFAHGLDSNDGNSSSPNGGTGETYGDITALLQTHSSCMGNGFMGTNCAGYGDTCTQCAGVRELDYTKHVGNAPYVPSMLDNAAGFRCTTDTCAGPCGYECHCESQIASQAIYELATRDLLTWGMDQATAWQTVDRLWYVSRPTASSAYSCSSTGTAPNKVFTTSGCVNNTLWRGFRAADDDDGNLNNGTPHMTALSAAFNRHVIACTTDAGYNTDSTACTGLGRPVVNATASNTQVLVNWSAVAGTTNYLVYRNETSCAAGSTKVGTVAAPTTTFTDNLVVNGITYFYRIQAQGSDADCLGAVSECATATPLACTAPAAPAGLTATANGTYRIDLSWGSVAGALQYALYRGTASGGPYAALATVSAAATAYSDTTPIGGQTYYYVVRTFDGCESINSAQASATAGGTCNGTPAFAGIAAAANALASTCGNVITWPAATPACGGSVTYTVHRSRDAGFTPGTGTAIASGLSGTTYTDTGVVFGTVYHYAVRAVDAVSGLSDSNAVVKTASPTGAAASLHAQAFETTSDWSSTTGTPAASTGNFVRGTPVATVGNLGEPSQPGAAHGGTNCWYTATNPAGSAGVDDVDGGEVITVSPQIDASAYPTARIQLYRWFVNEYTDDSGDYYVLEGSNNNGSSWVALDSLPDTVSIQGGSTMNQWNFVDVKVDDFITPLTTQMRFRIRAADGTAKGGLIECAMDDISVKGYPLCTGCTPPSTPTGLSATPVGANRIDLSWSAASGAATYRVYRKSGSCGSGYTQIAGALTGTTFSDTTVSGGSGYAYVVRALNSGSCESADSVCAAATAAGVCTLPPTFAGLSTATNSHAATCGIALAWGAATSNCSGTIGYNVYRSTVSSFAPGPSTLLAKAVSATTYTDTLGLLYGTSYTYLVRAEDLSVVGPGPSGGTEDGNTVRLSTGPSGGQITAGTLFFDDFERTAGSLDGYDVGYFALNANDWRGTQVCSPRQSGTTVFRWGGTSCTADYQASAASLVAPLPNPYGVDIPFDATNLRLSFYHRGLFGTGAGALLMLQKQPSRTYVSVPAAAIIGGRAYNGTTNTTNPLPSYPCWNGSYNTAMYESIVDLDAACIAIDGKPCGGSTLGIAFVGSSSTSVSDGWFIDDVRVTADYGTTTCTTAGCAMVVQVTPAADSAPVGEDLLFAVSHTQGNGPFSYQWTEDGSDIADAAGTTLAVNKSSAGSHIYNCKVTDLGGACSNILASTGASGTWTAAGGTAAPVPSSVTPTLITRHDAAGTDITVTWDATNCTSTDYHIIWGYGANVATLGGSSPVVSGGKCDIGTGGALNHWSSGVPDPASDPGAGKFVWFLVVGDDGATAEGSWGTITGGAQRGGTANSGQCACTSRDTTTTCPTP